MDLRLAGRMRERRSPSLKKNPFPSGRGQGEGNPPCYNLTMPEKRSVVTAKRFSSGFTYEGYVAQIERNRDAFHKFLERGQLLPEDKAFFQKAGKAKGGFSRMLVISEDWCPYAVRAVPLMEHIAGAAGAEMRVFTRDGNPDIMKEFLNRGKFESIPVAVFYTDDMKEICRWIEKPGTMELKLEATLPKRQDFQQESAREMRLLLAEKLGL